MTCTLVPALSRVGDWLIPGASTGLSILLDRASSSLFAHWNLHFHFSSSLRRISFALFDCLSLVVDKGLLLGVSLVVDQHPGVFSCHFALSHVVRHTSPAKVTFPSMDSPLRHIG